MVWFVLFFGLVPRVVLVHKSVNLSFALGYGLLIILLRGLAFPCEVSLLSIIVVGEVLLVALYCVQFHRPRVCYVSPRSSCLVSPWVSSLWLAFPTLIRGVRNESESPVALLLSSRVLLIIDSYSYGDVLG
jgi:hypothetical protein